MGASSRRWVGSWYLVRGPSGWLLVTRGSRRMFLNAGSVRAAVQNDLSTVVLVPHGHHLHAAVFARCQPWLAVVRQKCLQSPTYLNSLNHCIHQAPHRGRAV